MARRKVRTGAHFQPDLQVNPDHIINSAEVVKAVNARLNAPQVVAFSNAVNRELDAVITAHVDDACRSLGVTDTDTKIAIKTAVTCSLYLKLEDLLVELKRNNITLTTHGKK